MQNVFVKSVYLVQSTNCIAHRITSFEHFKQLRNVMNGFTNDEKSILNTSYDRLRIGTSWDSCPGRFHPPVVQVAVIFHVLEKNMTGWYYWIGSSGVSPCRVFLHVFSFPFLQVIGTSSTHLQIQRSSGAIGQIHPAHPQKILIDLSWMVFMRSDIYIYRLYSDLLIT